MYRQKLERIFAVDFAAKARLEASNVRGKSRAFSAKNLVDENEATYWATDDAVTAPELEVDFRAERQVGVIRLREAIALGQRIGAFGIDAWQDGTWKEIVKGTSIGACRLIRLETPVATSKLRLRITDSPVCIMLAELAVFGAVD
jgi:alpha-L-fucosidase